MRCRGGRERLAPSAAPRGQRCSTDLLTHFWSTRHESDYREEPRGVTWQAKLSLGGGSVCWRWGKSQKYFASRAKMAAKSDELYRRRWATEKYFVNVRGNGRHGYGHVVSWGLFERSLPKLNKAPPPLPARQAGDEHVVRNIEWTGFRRCDRLPTGRFGRQVAPVTGAVDSNALLWIDYYFLRSIACVLNPYYCYHYHYYY